MAATSIRVRNVALALLGALVLVLKGRYAGPGATLVHGYAGNVSVSFALYFAAVSATHALPPPRWWAAGLTLAAVTAFELSDGFGVMANVVDLLDLPANALGVGLAVLVDVAWDRFAAHGAERGRSAGPDARAA